MLVLLSSSKKFDTLRVIGKSGAPDWFNHRICPGPLFLEKRKCFRFSSSVFDIYDWI